VDRLERLPRGYGIMGDDLMAGLYGNLLLQAAIRVFPGVF
jgi:phosphatidylglycerophosphatase A